MQKKKILIVGESWTIITTHIKGVDHFTQSTYGEGIKWLKAALESCNMDVIHMPSHIALTNFPSSIDEISKYDCVIFSDIGSNTLLLHPATTSESLRTPNRLEIIKDYVVNGGAFLMIGGYMSFQGIEGKANYHDTVIEAILPVNMMSSDDRVETPQGIFPHYKNRNHQIINNLPEQFPFFLSYNKVIPKQEATVLLTFERDPLLVIWEYQKGRTAAFAADCAPHGAPPEFLEWEYFNTFWCDLINWLIN